MLIICCILLKNIKSEYKEEYRKLVEKKANQKKREQEEKMKKLEKELKSGGSIGQRVKSLNLLDDEVAAARTPQISLNNQDDDEDEDAADNDENGKVYSYFQLNIFL
jgi:hypothetical protein